jgi:hypothetical protein
MRVTLSLRNNYQRVHNGRAMAVPFDSELTTDFPWRSSPSSARRTRAST